MTGEIAQPRDPFCAECDKQSCIRHTVDQDAPAYCPTLSYEGIVASAKRQIIDDPLINKIALAAARTEMEGYLKWTRVEEIVQFGRKIGATTLGIATCGGLLEEARLAANIFRKRGFKVISVCCKVGSVDKEEVGLAPDERIFQGQFEAICMPLAQADILNERATDLNVLIGLCVGHDSIFFRRSKAPVTVLVAKDRVLGHNPAAALYTSRGYYSKLARPDH